MSEETVRYDKQKKELTIMSELKLVTPTGGELKSKRYNRDVYVEEDIKALKTELNKQLNDLQKQVKDGKKARDDIKIDGEYEELVELKKKIISMQNVDKLQNIKKKLEGDEEMLKGVILRLKNLKNAVPNWDEL